MRRIGILPAYNEAAYLPDVLREITGIADLWILVDDGSTDGSGDLLKQWAQDNPACFLGIKTNRGKAYALRVAFDQISLEIESGSISPDDVIFTTDADGQIPRNEILQSLEEFDSSGKDVLVCRRDFSIYPAFKIWGNRLLSLNASILSGFRYMDSECGLRIMRAGTIPLLLKYYRGVKYSAEQELSVLCPRLGLKTGNNFLIHLRFYRSNTRIMDFVINIAMGWYAFFRTIRAGGPEGGS